MLARVVLLFILLPPLPLMLIGYARVSTLEQNLHLQEDALQQSGCEKIIIDKLSGALADRPGLTKIKELLRRGDTLVVWRLDRLGRSLKDLIEWMHYLDKEGVALKSLQEAIDTSTATGKLVFHLFGALSEFERNLIRERTQAGLMAARARGRKGGRPKSLDKDKRELVISLYEEKKLPVKKICEMMNITKPTLYSYVKSKGKTDTGAESFEQQGRGGASKEKTPKNGKANTKAGKSSGPSKGAKSE